jgi:PAS domain S-box-containing protein
MSPLLHAVLVGCAAVTTLVSAAVCLARSPGAFSVRLHAVYAATASWWLISMGMVAGALSVERAQLWARLAQLGVGVLPATVYHVNIAVAGLNADYRGRIRLHYALSAVITIFGLAFPDLLAAPRVYPWGYYPAYTSWGLIPVAAMLVVFVEVIVMYRAAVRRYEPGTPEYQRARAFHYGNCVAFLAAVDFLPAFGVTVYPFGFATVGLMSAATMFGSARYRLIEITPQIAAERILETMPDGLLVVDMRGRVQVANAAAARLLGQGIDGLLRQPLTSICTDARLRDTFAVPEGALDNREVPFTAADGVSYVVSVACAPVEDAGKLVAHVWLLHDLTGQRQAEAERAQMEGMIRQTQKMESLGVMAGGIAHDFNNILMAILGSAEVAKMKLDAGEAVREDLETISASVEQAAALTNQLLTYAGREDAVEGAVDLNTLCIDMTELLRSAISRKAQLSMDLAKAVPPIRCDSSQMRQVILNLVKNASDALGDRPGAITVRTAVVEPPEAGAAGAGARPGSGRRVLIEVADTGAGMDEATRARVFDPFFTTKFTGRGLGLAIVFRIVRGLGGLIDVASTPGEGSTFRLWLPALDEATLVPAPVTARTEEFAGRGLALLADDESIVRRAVREMLRVLGYQVVEAGDGVAAVELFRARPDDFALAVLDITMPGLSGREAAAEIRRLAHALPVVFISGNADAAEASTEHRLLRTAFVRKPFKRATLESKIREAVTAAA